MVPDVVGPDDGDGPGLTHPQAIRLGSLDAPPLGQAELAEPGLEKGPGLEPALLGAALGLGLIAAQEDVAAGLMAAEVFENPRGKRDVVGWVVQRNG